MGTRHIIWCGIVVGIEKVLQPFMTAALADTVIEVITQQGRVIGLGRVIREFGIEDSPILLGLLAQIESDANDKVAIINVKNWFSKGGFGEPQLYSSLADAEE